LSSQENLSNKNCQVFVFKAAFFFLIHKVNVYNILISPHLIAIFSRLELGDNTVYILWRYKQSSSSNLVYIYISHYTSILYLYMTLYIKSWPSVKKKINQAVSVWSHTKLKSYHTARENQTPNWEKWVLLYLCGVCALEYLNWQVINFCEDWASDSYFNWPECLSCWPWAILIVEPW